MAKFSGRISSQILLFHEPSETQSMSSILSNSSGKNSKSKQQRGVAHPQNPRASLIKRVEVNRWRSSSEITLQWWQSQRREILGQSRWNRVPLKPCESCSCESSCFFKTSKAIVRFSLIYSAIMSTIWTLIIKFLIWLTCLNLLEFPKFWLSSLRIFQTQIRILQIQIRILVILMTKIGQVNC